MDKQTKSVVVQWIGPLILLIIALAIMVFNFSAKSKAKAYDAVTKNMTSSAESCLVNFTQQLATFQVISEPIAELLEQEDNLNSAYVVDLLNIIMKYSGAYEVYLCDAAGNGVNSAGENVSVEDKYFASIKDEEESSYHFVHNDDMEEEDVILADISIDYHDETRYLISFYQLDDFEETVKKNNFVEWNLVSLINSDGTVLFATGTANEWVFGDNIYEGLRGANEDTVKRMKSRIINKSSGMNTVTMGEMTNSLAYVPAGINGWMFMVGIPQDYIDKLVSQQWKDVRNIMTQLILVILVFICIVVGINIVSKLYTVNKQKQLEVKADTDLLTGLNNKLATERKIKEFIAKNPEAQSMMFILDIDNFKKINDTLGHAFGDEVLRSLGQQLGAIFRASDIVGRAGGDEFIVFLKNIKDAADIRKEAKRVEDFFKDFKAGEYTKYSATASIGLAIYPEEGEDFESIYKAADRALYMAKERGKNQLAFYKEKWLKEE